MAALCFIINEQKAQLDSEKRVLERRREDADALSHRRANLSLYYLSGQHKGRNPFIRLEVTDITSQGTSKKNLMKLAYCPRRETRQLWPQPHILPPTRPMTKSTCRSFKLLHSKAFGYCKQQMNHPATRRQEGTLVEYSSIDISQ
jgi:hypothetical protein